MDTLTFYGLFTERIILSTCWTLKKLFISGVLNFVAACENAASIFTVKKSFLCNYNVQER